MFGFCSTLPLKTGDPMDFMTSALVLNVYNIYFIFLFFSTSLLGCIQQQKTNTWHSSPHALSSTNYGNFSFYTEPHGMFLLATYTLLALSKLFILFSNRGVGFMKPNILFLFITNTVCLYHSSACVKISMQSKVINNYKCGIEIVHYE